MKCGFAGSTSFRSLARSVPSETLEEGSLCQQPLPAKLRQLQVAVEYATPSLTGGGYDRPGQGDGKIGGKDIFEIFARLAFSI